jgi:2-keto-3-deoxy-L-rhamnonate aldolase RhmA
MSLNRAWWDIDGTHVVIDRLNRHLAVTALGVRGARTPEIARLAKASGHDAIWVDLEHSAMPIDVAAQICACAADIGVVPLVRVPERERGVIGRLLDSGAMGIIAPRIETPEQAADVVSACRFPPLGHRSVIASLPLVQYVRTPAAALYDIANRATLVKVLVESPLGIDNLSAIAAVPGVDIVAIGTNDLSAELGVPGEFEHALVRQAHDHALEACRRAGKPLVIGGITDAAYCAELIRRGAAPFLMTGIDTDLLLAAAGDRVRQALSSIA